MQQGINSCAICRIATQATQTTLKQPYRFLQCIRIAVGIFWIPAWGYMYHTLIKRLLSPKIHPMISLGLSILHWKRPKQCMYKGWKGAFWWCCNSIEYLHSLWCDVANHFGSEIALQEQPTSWQSSTATVTNRVTKQHGFTYTPRKYTTLEQQTITSPSDTDLRAIIAGIESYSSPTV